jgi:SAM-dependent methyltransferase
MKPVPPNRDAYGRQIWGFLNGGSPTEIVERDDGYVNAAPTNASYFADFSHWTKPEQRAIRFARGRTALDVGCGAGRVALHLQARGFRVIAIDSSPLAVKTARTRGVKDARLLPFENIHTLPAGIVDTVIMFGNNFGLFGSRSRARRLLRQLHRITREGAVLLAHSLDPHQTDEPAHRKYQRLNGRRGRMPGQIRIRIRYEEWIGPWFDYLLVSPAEMSTIVHDTGWEVDRFFTVDNPRFTALIRRL